MLTLEPSDLRPASQSRINFDNHHPHKKKQVNRSSHLKQANFGPHTVEFDLPHKKQVTFDPNTKTKWNSITHTKIKLILTPLLKSSQFHPHPEIMSSSMPHTKTWLIWIHTPKPSIFRPPRNPSQFRSLHWSHVNFDPHHKTKPILMPRHPNHVNLNFDPTIKTKYFSTPTLKPSQWRSLRWNQLNLDPPPQPSQFRSKR